MKKPLFSLPDHLPLTSFRNRYDNASYPLMVSMCFQRIPEKYIRQALKEEVRVYCSDRYRTFFRDSKYAENMLYCLEHSASFESFFDHSTSVMWPIFHACYYENIGELLTTNFFSKDSVPNDKMIFRSIIPTCLYMQHLRSRKTVYWKDVLDSLGWKRWKKTIEYSMHRSHLIAEIESIATECIEKFQWKKVQYRLEGLMKNEIM